MIRFIIIIALFFSVLALSPFLLEEPGYVLITMGDSIFELTVYAALFWITTVLVVLFFVYKFIRGGFNISFKAWNHVAFASRRRGITNFNKGLTAYLLEDYESAEQLFAKSAEPAKRQQSAYLLAASAAEKQNLDANTNHYLLLLEQEAAKTSDSDLSSVIVKVKLLMNQGRNEAYKKARSLIDENHKKIGHDTRLLALEIDLCLVEKRFDEVINNLTSARKDKKISDEVIQAWEEKAYYGIFNEMIIKQDHTALQAYWKTIDRKIKQRETVLLCYCQVLAEQSISEPVITIIAPLLKKQPNASFLKRLRNLPIKQNEALIAIAQKHLHNDNYNAQWLSFLGHLAFMSEQWSMADKSFRSLLKLEANQQKKQYDKQDLQAFAKALTAEEQHQAANEIWAKLNTF